jgi:hypothetical protein
MESQRPLQRLLLHRLSAIDPVFWIGKGKTRVMAGLHIRAHNDAIPLRFAPGQVVRQQSLDNATREANADLSFGPGESRSTNLTTITIPIAKGGNLELAIPLVADDDMGGGFLNWRIRPSGGARTTVLEIDAVRNVISIGDGPRPTQASYPLSEEGMEIALRPGRNFALYTRGTLSEFLVGFTCVAVDPDAAALRVRLREGSVAAVDVSGRTLSDARFAVFAHPVGERLVGGVPTFSLAASPVAAAVFDPFTFRVMHWLYCAPTPFDVPLTDPALDPPRLQQPFITWGVDTGVVVPRTANVCRWFDNARALVIAGDPPPALVEETAASDRWPTLTLISTRPDLVERAMRANGGARGTDPDEPAVCWSRTSKTVIGAIVDSARPSRAVMERAAESAAAAVRERAPGVLPELTAFAAARRRRARRPALPYTPDLGIAMVSLAGNMTRGRLPDDDGTIVPDYSIYARDDLWLVPWSAPVHPDRSWLLFDLNVRIASEWIATRACVELYGGSSWVVDAADSGSADEAKRLVRRAFREWLPGGVDARAEPAERRAAVLARAGIGPSEALRILAEAAYDACLGNGEYAGLHPQAEGLSFANPCVLVLTSGGEHQMDLKLNANAGAWAAVAARTGGAKPGIIVPTLLGPGALDELRSIQACIRQIVVEQCDDDAMRSVAPERARLGQALRERLEPATELLLAQMNPERVIAFSDIVLDALPHGRSILGLERPCCRFPADTNVSQYVAQMVVASRRSLSHTWRRRAAIVIAPQPNDEVTAWALELATALEDALARIGQACVRPVQKGANLDSVLAAISDCSMVFFVGHGEVAVGSAGLNIGVGKIDIGAIRAYDWSDKFICLIGCETAAIDSSDMAAAFLAGGARAVIGTLTEIRVDVARAFFEAFLRWSADVRAPIDYAFFGARCEAALYEILLGTGMPIGEATAAEASALFARHGTFAGSLDELGLEWAGAQAHVLFSMSLSLLGGASETLV